MRVVAIIPARGGSKGIPMKNLIEFCGKPLIVWSIEQARASKYIKNVYVSSDDKKILTVSENSGAKPIKRPKKLATDTSSVEKTLLHAINYIQKFNKEKINIVVFLQPTSPVRSSEDIDAAIEFFISQKADSLFSAAILEDFCIWNYQNGELASLTYDYKNRGRRQDRAPLYLENGSIYIFKPETLKKYNNRLGDKIIMFIMNYWKSYEIDKLEDVEICEYFKQKILNKHPKGNV